MKHNFFLSYTHNTQICVPGGYLFWKCNFQLNKKNSLLTTDKQSANVYTRRGIGHSASLEKSFLPTLTHIFLQMGIYTVGSCLHYIGHSSLITKFLPSTNILWSWSFLNGNICDLAKCQKIQCSTKLSFSSWQITTQLTFEIQNFWNSQLQYTHLCKCIHTGRFIHYIGYAKPHGK